MGNKTFERKIMHIVAFKILDREYGVNILQVREIIRSRRITPIPEAASFIEGVIVLRGKVMPLVNLRKKLGIEAKALDKKSRIIIAQLEGHCAGMIVDEVSDVLSVDDGNIIAPDEALQEAKYLIGLVNIGKRLILLVDMIKLLSHEESVDVRKIYDRVEVRRP